jgi:hypothetical protein
MSKKVSFMLVNSMYTLDGIRSALGLSVENMYTYTNILYNEVPAMSEYHTENIDWIRDMEGEVYSTVPANCEKFGLAPITIEELGKQLRDMDVIIPYGIMRPVETNDNFN